MQQLYKHPRLNDYDGDLERRWYIQYSFRNPDTNKFTVFREWVTNTHKTKSARYLAAKNLIDKIRNKLLMGFNPFKARGPEENICKSLEKINAIKATTLRKRTAHSYTSVSHLFCSWLNKNGYKALLPHQLTRAIIQAYFDHSLLVEKISPRTYNNRLRSLRTLFNELVKRENLEFNIFTKIALLPETEPALIAYTGEEKILIKKHLETQHKPLWLVAMFIYYTLARPAELVRLKFDCINWENKTLLISGANSKNKKTRIVLIPDQLIDLLLQMGYDFCIKDHYIFSNGVQLTPGHKEITPNRIFNTWQKFVIDPLKIKKGIYLFKHTGAGELFDNGAGPRDIQLQLGHSSLEETVVYLNKYSNRPNESLRKHFTII